VAFPKVQLFLLLDFFFFSFPFLPLLPIVPHSGTAIQRAVLCPGGGDDSLQASCKSVAAHVQKIKNQKKSEARHRERIFQRVERAALESGTKS